MKCRIIGLATALTMALGTTAGMAETAVPESHSPIKLAMLEWTGQQAVTNIAGKLLEKMGYTVEFVTSGTYTQFLAIPDGSITASLEVWSSNTGEHYPKAMASGNVEKIGALGLDPVETWYYNKAAGEACPGLPDWMALKDCAQALAVAETFPTGRLLDYPADWGTTNADRIEALELPMVSIPAGSEGALVAEITSAEKSDRPLLVMFWSPHWVHAVAELTPVALPPYEAGCYDDPKVGINPLAVYDCDWQRGEIMKLAWVGMKKEWPAAYRLLEQMTITNKDEIAWMRDIDSNGKDMDSVLAAWMVANQPRWQGWIDAAMKE